VEFIENDFSPKHKKIYLSELVATGMTDKFKEDVRGNIVKFIFDKELPSEAYEKICEKMAALQPNTITFEYTHSNNIITLGDINKFTGINVEDSLREYIELIEDISNKKEVIDYLLRVYEQTKTKQVEGVVDEQ